MQKDEMNKVVFVQKILVIHPTDKNKFLILKRNTNDVSRPGDFDIPGGRVRFNETHDNALLRELKEEIGIDVDNIKPIIVNSRIQKEEDLYFLYIGYSANALSENVTINKEEHGSYEWVDIEVFIRENPRHILTEQLRKLKI